MDYLKLIFKPKFRITLFYRFLGITLTPVDIILSVILSLFKSNKDETPKLIFIIGLPRSGTTILYQYLSQHYKFIYTSNLWSILPRSAPYIKSILALSPPDETSSFYGNGFKMSSVQEGGSIHQLWFNNQHYVENINPPTLEKMRTYFSTVSSTSNRTPILIKNTRNCVRVELLQKAFPHATFIHIKRKSMEVAQSIYKGRIDLMRDINHNFTVEPKEWDQIKHLSFAEQIASQVFYLERNVEEGLQKVNSNQIVEIDYSVFCENPKLIVDKLINHGVDMIPRSANGIDVRYNLRYNSTIKIDKSVYSQIEKAYLALYEENKAVH